MDQEDTRKHGLHRLNQIIMVQSRLASADFNLDAFMNLAVNQMHELTPATGVVIELVEADEMVYRAATGSVENHVGLRLKMENSISGLSILTQKILSSEDTEVDTRVNVEACRRVAARSLVVAPLFHEGKPVGVLKILSNKVSAFNAADVQVLQLMAGFIGAALAHQIYYESNQKLLIERTRALNELEKAHERLEHLANHDYLTDLPNRSLFTNKFENAMRHAQQNHQLYALVYLDIDHFKKVNDNLGHSIGDELLKGFAERLKQCVRVTDTVARLGGDEFVLILKLSTHEEAINILKAIIKRMQDIFNFHGQTLKITTSLGMTYFQNNDNDATKLIKQADQALYEAKKAGRNTYRIFEKEKEFA